MQTDLQKQFRREELVTNLVGYGVLALIAIIGFALFVPTF